MLILTDNPKTANDEVYVRITNTIRGRTKCSHFHLWNHTKVVVTTKEE